MNKDFNLNGLLSYFSQVPLLMSLPADTLKQLERIAEQRHYRRRQVIHFPDQASDFVYLLCSGRVKISRVSEQGREVTLALLEGASLFGEAGLLLAGQPYDQIAETLEDSRVAVFRRSDILGALTNNPQAMLELLRMVNERRAMAEAMIGDLVFLDVPRRLAKLLLRLHEDHSSKTGRSAALIKAKLTHQELANMVGSTRETTTLVLNEFKRMGYIDFVGRKIIIRSQTDLEGILRRTQVISK